MRMDPLHRRGSSARRLRYYHRLFCRPLFSCFVAVFALLLCAPTLRAQIQLVWRIGLEDDPFESGYDPTHEFSQENFINDPRPGKVTRLLGDPLYNAANNPAADDDFYCAGTTKTGPIS